MADMFLESCGTVLFRLSTRQICILRLIKTDEYVLPKGRRNVGESHPATAIRETTEEAGIPCRLLPINMHSRACPAVEAAANAPDEARFYEAIHEPIAVQTRHSDEMGLRLIWWFVAAVNEGEPIGQHEDDTFDVEFHSHEDTLQKLTFDSDRKVVQKAIDIVTSTIGNRELA